VPEVIVPEVIVPEVIVPEVVEPEVVEPEAPADLMFSAAPDPAIFGSMDALEAIFSAAAVSKIVSVTGEEPQEAAAVEPADTGVPDVPGTNGIPTVPAPEPVDADASGLEVVFGAAEEEAPAPAGIEEPPVRETAGTPAATEAPAAPDFFVEAWSAESGLVAVTLFSGILPVRSSLIAALETTLSCEPGPGGISRIGGEGTMLLDCGPGEPLMLDAAIGTKVRGAFLAMLPDGDRLLAETRVDGLSEVVSAEGTKLLFGAETPVRKITVEGGTPLLVRAASIAAASPGVEISGDPTLDGYLRAAGQGRVYLIE